MIFKKEEEKCLYRELPGNKCIPNNRIRGVTTQHTVTTDLLFVRERAHPC